MFNIECILTLLKSEREDEQGSNETEEDASCAWWSRIRGRIANWWSWIRGRIANRWSRIQGWSQASDKWLRVRESVLSCVLLSPPVVACAALVLFCAGILMFAWDKRPRPVAIFTSATAFICVLLLIGFFVRHRRKHVIRKLYLGRLSF